MSRKKHVPDSIGNGIRFSLRRRANFKGSRQRLACKTGKGSGRRRGNAARNLNRHRRGAETMPARSLSGEFLERKFRPAMCGHYAGASLNTAGIGGSSAVHLHGEKGA
jgi:hypothetical protein